MVLYNIRYNMVYQTKELMAEGEYYYTNHIFHDAVIAWQLYDTYSTYSVVCVCVVYIIIDKTSNPTSMKSRGWM